MPLVARVRQHPEQARPLGDRQLADGAGRTELVVTDATCTGAYGRAPVQTPWSFSTHKAAGKTYTSC
jgi:hypothetical protein